jgi:hypothetical protein
MRGDFDKRFNEQWETIERQGRLVRAGAAVVACAAVLLAIASIYVGAHFIAKFW